MVKQATSPLVDSELAARFSLGVIELFQGSPATTHIYTAAKNAFHWAGSCLDLLQTVNPEPEPRPVNLAVVSAVITKWS